MCSHGRNQLKRYKIVKKACVCWSKYATDFIHPIAFDTLQHGAKNSLAAGFEPGTSGSTVRHSTICAISSHHVRGQNILLACTLAIIAGMYLTYIIPVSTPPNCVSEHDLGEPLNPSKTKINWN